MQRGVAGFLGGVIGGFVKLVLDQATFAINISSVNTISTISRFLSVGWFVSKIFSKEFPREYFSSGLLLGVIIWE